MTTLVPNSVAVFGTNLSTVDVVLRSVLKFRETITRIIVLDYTGRGAMVLGPSNKLALMNHPVHWCDLADRYHPSALFQLRRSEHLKTVLSELLKTMCRISRISLTEATLSWAVEAAYNLSAQGKIGLGALLKSLSSPEMYRWFHDTQENQSEIVRLLKMLSWVLGFSSVYAVSEAVNSVDLENILTKKGTLWIEAKIEHFEPCEHRLVTALMEAAIEDAFRASLASLEKRTGAPPQLAIVHLFPPTSFSDRLAQWVRETSQIARHIGVHRLQPERPLAALSMSWARETRYIWITGKTSKSLKGSVHSNWLTVKETEQINNLDDGAIWVKSNTDNRAIVVRVHRAADYLKLDDKLRSQSSRLRKIVPVRQMSSALSSIVEMNTTENNLYGKLCDRETLRLGWFRLSQNAKKDSHGMDNVTISTFKDNLENELSKLSGELKAGEYRCKPLRHAYISKPDGGKRMLSIACVRDKVVQNACLFLLEPIFETVFSHYSFAFRPRRSTHQALAVLRSRIAAGHSWAVIADINKCFDSIDHEVLLRLLAKRIGDQDLMALVRHWVKAEVLNFHDLLPMEIGIPQGESLSPLLANIYLDPLDKHLEKLGLDFVRYADDIILLTNTEKDAQKALHILRDFLLDPLRLQLKPAKTNYVAVDTGFEFVGFRICGKSIEIKQERIDDVEEMILLYLKTLGNPVSTFEQKTESLTKINAVIRGWRNYFCLPDEKRISEQLRALHGRTDQAATFYLPSLIRDDPAWICRERFTVQQPIENLETEEAAAEREAKTGSGYPKEEGNSSPPGWMVKGISGNVEKETNTISSIVLNDMTDRNEPLQDNTKDTLFEENGRLYVLTHGSYLTLSGQDLVIRKHKSEIYRCPLVGLGMLYLQGFGITVSVDLQLGLAERDIPVVFTPPVGEPVAVLNPVSSSTSTLRGLQVLRRNDPDVVSTGLAMLASKMSNQAAVLKYFSKYRKKIDPELGCQIIEAAATIRELAESVKNLDPTSASIRSTAMGFEGHAASVYWGKLTGLIPSALNFSGRVLRAATDPVNQCLNYTYGILYGEVWRAVVKAGLDPYFGLIHGSLRDQGSLVFDLIEEFRAPFVDRLILGMLGRGFIPKTGENGLLRTKIKKQLAGAFMKRWFDKAPFRSKTMDPASFLVRQAKDLARLFGREGTYHPFKMKW